MTPTDLSAGRTNQKLRTRRALVAAANDLLERGATPTLEDVAEAALVSRATAYRYFSSVDELVAEAFFDRTLAPSEDVLAAVPDDDLLQRVLAVEEAINGNLLRDDLAVALHTVGRLFMNQWLDGDGDDRVPRPGRRLPLLDAALEPFADRLGPERLERLRNGLALVIGMEAVITLRDVLGLDGSSARQAARWAAETMVAAALADASN